ncbi:MAG: cupin domain-containing protein [Flavobacteriales bacterium]|nr:cupin domain-containing protein [Flavobacteriales bacterium]
MKTSITLTFLFLIYIASAQTIKSTYNLEPAEEYDNLYIQKIDTDSLSTTFAIWIKLQVKMHKHLNHVENVYILEGTGEFTVSDSTYEVKKGDLIVIPKNTWHGVTISSKKPMKAISIQSPEFKGLDRVFK